MCMRNLRRNDLTKENPDAKLKLQLVISSCPRFGKLRRSEMLKKGGSSCSNGRTEHIKELNKAVAAEKKARRVATYNIVTFPPRNFGTKRLSSNGFRGEWQSVGCSRQFPFR
jgi:hypothetical protein